MQVFALLRPVSAVLAIFTISACQDVAGPSPTADAPTLARGGAAGNNGRIVYIAPG